MMSNAEKMDVKIEKREALELVSRRLDNKLKHIKLKEAEKELEEPDSKVVIEKISLLKDLITLKVIDSEKQLFPSDIPMVNAFDWNEIQFFKNQIKKLITKF